MTTSKNEPKKVDPRFSPVFAAPSPRPASLTEEWLLTAVSYPGADAAASAVPRQRIAAPIADTENWLQKTMQTRAVAKEPVDWCGLPSTPMGAEVVFGAWSVGDRRVQIASRRHDLHVRTTLGELRNSRDSAEVFARAIEVGNELLRAELDPDPSTYKLAVLGEFLAGESLRSAEWGWRWVSFATDGVGVKYTMMKRRDGRAVKAGRQEKRDERPWFGEAAKK
jgi:hypothetical protein